MKPLLRAAFAVLVTLLAAVSTTAAEAPPWEWPQQAENLQVLPPDTSAEELRAAMGRFVRSLGVRCTHCHVGVEGQPLTTYDFASDDKPAKDKAREMVRMLRSIEAHLAKIEPSGERVEMGCHTCHRRKVRPQTLEEALGETFRQADAEAMVAHYRELRQPGNGVWDFSERSLNSLGYELLGAGEEEGAVAAFRLNAEEHPGSGNVWDSLAEAHLAAGQPELAEIYYAKSLAVDPDNDNALTKLREIRASARSGGTATPPGDSSE